MDSTGWKDSEGGVIHKCSIYIVNLPEDELEDIYPILPIWKNYIFANSFKSRVKVAERFPNSIFLESNGTNIKLLKLDNYLKNGQLIPVGLFKEETNEIIANNGEASLLENSMVS